MKNENFVKEWLEYAKRDYESALHLFDNMVPAPLEIICFHCQQSAEKNLKALLVAQGLKFDKTHDLSYLLNLSLRRFSAPAAVSSACLFLSQFGVTARYPGGSQVTEAETKKAVKSMNTITNWTLSVFKKLEREEKAAARALKKSRVAAKSPPGRSD